MFSKITSKIKVSVLSEYDIKNSFPLENRFAFRYNIIIENKNDFSITILKRKWLIFDSGFGFTEIQGDGVIGLIPKINPSEKFTYFSNAILKSGIGYMKGQYLVRNDETNENFDLDIPQFDLCSKILAN